MVQIIGFAPLLQKTGFHFFARRANAVAVNAIAFVEASKFRCETVADFSRN